MSDKRSVATDALETLGTLITDKEKRDAIHLGVEPVIAGEMLDPGTHIMLKDGKAYRTKIGGGVGIVDPFLAKEVEVGQRFWLIVYPRQITSLRHVWEHPNFPAAEETNSNALQESQAAIAGLAEHLGLSYEELMDAAKNFIESDEYLVGGDSFEGEYLPKDFWSHYSIVTNTPYLDRGNFLSCSC